MSSVHATASNSALCEHWTRADRASAAAGVGIMSALWSQSGLRLFVAGGTPLLLVVVRTLVVYAVMVLGLRLTGKREVGQFTPFDLVLVLLIANAVQNAMVGADNTLLGGVVAALTLFGVNWGVGRVVGRDPSVRRWLLGAPTILVSDGQVLDRNLAREGVTTDELEAAIREHGFDKASDVRLAYLEVDGTISVVPMDAAVFHSHRRVRQVKHG